VGTALLAAEIKQISTEKPAEVGATPELAAAISGKRYKFPANGLALKSLVLSLVDPNPHYDMEIYQRDPSQPPINRSGPVGLDGLYRRAECTSAITIASRGTWVNGSTFVLDRLFVGAGEEAQRFTLSFEGGRLHARAKNRFGKELSIDSEAGE
jgi:hypothetical protein